MIILIITIQNHVPEEKGEKETREKIESKRGKDGRKKGGYGYGENVQGRRNTTREREGERGRTQSRKGNTAIFTLRDEEGPERKREKEGESRESAVIRPSGGRGVEFGILFFISCPNAWRYDPICVPFGWSGGVDYLTWYPAWTPRGVPDALT